MTMNIGDKASGQMEILSGQVKELLYKYRIPYAFRVKRAVTEKTIGKIPIVQSGRFESGKLFF